MPDIDITPHIKMNMRLLFSLAGGMNNNDEAMMHPRLNEDIFLIDQDLICFATKNTDDKINPKNNDQINIGLLSNKYSKSLAILKTLAILPPKTANRK